MVYCMSSTLMSCVPFTSSLVAWLVLGGDQNRTLYTSGVNATFVTVQVTDTEEVFTSSACGLVGLRGRDGPLN